MTQQASSRAACSAVVNQFSVTLPAGRRRGPVRTPDRQNLTTAPWHPWQGKGCASRALLVQYASVAARFPNNRSDLLQKTLKISTALSCAAEWTSARYVDQSTALKNCPGQLRWLLL